MSLSATVQRVAFFFSLLFLVCLHLFNLVFNCSTELNCNKYPSVTVTTILIYFCFIPAGGDALVVIGNGEAVSKKKKKTRLLNLKRKESEKINRH